MSDSESPFVSGHAQLRWDTRTPDDSVSPETAWQRGIRTSNLGRPFGADEGRVHVPTETVLVRVANAIVTVLHVDRLPRDVRPDAESVLERGVA